MFFLPRAKLLFMAYEALCTLGLSNLSSLSLHPLPSTHFAPAILAFFLFYKHSELIPTTGPLHVVGPLVRMTVLLPFSWLAPLPSSHMSSYITCHLSTLTCFSLSTYSLETILVISFLTFCPPPLGRGSCLSTFYFLGHILGPGAALDT